MTEVEEIKQKVCVQSLACLKCRGYGKIAHMSLSTRALYSLAETCPDEPVPIGYKDCNHCLGTGERGPYFENGIYYSGEKS